MDRLEAGTDQTADQERIVYPSDRVAIRWGNAETEYGNVVAVSPEDSVVLVRCDESGVCAVDYEQLSHLGH